MFFCSSCKEDSKEVEKVGTKCNHVIFIGLDGWGGQYDVKEMPFLKEKISESLYTFDKKAVLPTGSAPNWASIFTGVPPEVHGYIEWDAKKTSIEYDFELINNIYPTIFQELRKTKPEYEIGMFFQWDGIKYLVDTLSCSFFCCYPIKQYSHRQFTDYIISYIKSSMPHFCAIVFDDPDAIGHKEGFYSQGYNQKLRELDKIEDIYQSVKDAKYFDSTIFIITSDHGGINKTHGGDS